MKSTLPAVIPCTITPVVGRDEYAQPALGTPRPERCAVVKNELDAKHTTVRADSSATRGYAYEFIATNKILLKPETTARIGDKLTVQGIDIRIVGLMERTTVWGHLDHFEVSGQVWE